MEEMSAILKELPKSPKGYGSFYAALCEKVPLGPIPSKEEHNTALNMLGTLGQFVEEGRLPAQEEEAAIAYLQALGHFVAEFEKTVYRPGPVKGVDVLQELMERHNLNQSSFVDEIGAQPVVSRILKGERQLTREHIENLARRFNVSPAVFFDRP
jgi:HTH-type transcriptional regulator/antitoxin HigA